ncbi:MAG: alpha-2-macroglobulin family protein [Thermoplasmata archaeon]
MAFAVIGIILASSVAAFRADQIYLAGRGNTTLWVPDRLYTDIPTTLLVLATTSEGAPVANQDVTVDLITSGGVSRLYAGRTGPDGVALPTVIAPTGDEEGKLVVASGGDVVTRTVRLASSVRIFLSTDKPIYQPGQTVHIRTLTFEGEASAVSTREITLDVISPDGDRIFRKALDPNDFGIASFDYPLGAILPLGTYKLVAEVAGSTASAAFVVKHYVLPKFRVSLQGVKGWYAVDESVSGEVLAEYFFGKPVDGHATLQLFYVEDGYESVGSASTLLIEGHGSFNIRPRWDSIPDNPRGYFGLNVTAVDQADQVVLKTVRLPVAQYPILLTVVEDSNVIGATSTCYVIARYPDGTPVAYADVEYRPPGYSTSYTKTDDRGVARFSFSFRRDGTMRIVVSKGSDSSWVELSQVGGEGVKVVSDKSSYDVGDEAHFDIFYEGPPSTPWAYYEVSSRGFVIATGRVEIQSGRGYFTLPIRQDMVPQARVKVYKIGTNLQVFKDVLILPVGTLNELKVIITTEKPQYRPHEPITISFAVSDQGEPIVSALGVSIVDQAVFEVGALPDELEEALRGLDRISPEEEIIDYLYTDEAVVTTLAPPVVKESSESNSTMISTYAYHAQKAAEIRAASLSGLWQGLFLAMTAGYMGLIYVIIRYPEGRSASFATLVITLVTVALVFPLYTMTGGLIGGTTTSPAGEPGTFGEPSESDLGGEWWRLGTAIDLDEETSSLDAQMEYTVRQPTRVRHFFPETWYWHPSLITDEMGEASISLTTPDSITSWQVGAVASTKDARLGAGFKDITVFQEFFVEPDVPLAAVVGDEFPLRVAVYNYLEEANQVLVTLDNASWLTILDGDQRLLDLSPNSVQSTYFTIRPEEFGVHSFLITAGNARISDAVQRNLTVEPKGRWVERVFSGKLDNDDDATVMFSLNPNRVPESETAIVKVQAGVTSFFLDGAESYIVFVSGCGEQSTSRLSVDAAAYKHLLDGGKSPEELAPYEQTIIEGIQHELTFVKNNPDGPGRAVTWYYQPPPDKWLTAWALFAFRDLKETGFDIDDRLIEDIQTYLVSTMESDGSFVFPDVGHWSINSELRGERVAATAYVLRALLYSGYEHDSKTSKALSYIENHLQMDDSAFTLALALTAMEMAGGSRTLRDQAAQELLSLAKDGGNGTLYWEYEASPPGEEPRITYYYGRNVIETTAYAVIGLWEHGGYRDKAQAGVRFMLTHRDTGHWGSTHDTAVAFQALSVVGGSALGEIAIRVQIDGGPVAETTFTEEDEDRTYLVDITDYLSEAMEVELYSSGQGLLVYQVVVRENIPETSLDPLPSPLLFTVDFDKTESKVGDIVTGQVTVAYVGDRNATKMVLVDLRAPVGMCFKTDEFEAFLARGVIGMYEVSCQQALVYLENLERDVPIEFEFTLNAIQPIRATLQGMNAFDMYDPMAVAYLDPLEIVVEE